MCRTGWFWRACDADCEPAVVPGDVAARLSGPGKCIQMQMALILMRPKGPSPRKRAGFTGAQVPTLGNVGTRMPSKPRYI